MSDKDPVKTLKTGTCVFAISWQSPAKNANFELMLRVPLLDGLIEIYTLEDHIYIIAIEVSNSNHQQVDEWISPQLVRDQDQPIILSFVWEYSKIKSVRINGRDVPSVDTAEYFYITQSAASEISFHGAPKRPKIQSLEGRVQFESMTFRQLFQTASRLENSLYSLQLGHAAHLFDIANHLRTLLTGTEENGGRLIFRCASEIDYQPICFVPEDQDEPPVEEIPNADWFLYVASAWPIGKARKAVEIEKWLSCTAIFNSEMKIKNWELIREVADRFGAHAESFDSLKRSSIVKFLNHHNVVVSFDILQPAFISLADLALWTCIKILRKAEEASAARTP